MGILDNTFVKMLLQGPPQVMRDMQREQQALQAQGILQNALTGTQPDAFGMGPVRPMDYMGTAAQLAALPQYQPMVAQMLAQGGLQSQSDAAAMGRLQYQTTTPTANALLAEAGMDRRFGQTHGLDIRRFEEGVRQFGVGQDWAQYQHENPSAYQRQSLLQGAAANDIARANAGTAWYNARTNRMEYDYRVSPDNPANYKPPPGMVPVAPAVRADQQRAALKLPGQLQNIGEMVQLLDKMTDDPRPMIFQRNNQRAWDTKKQDLVSAIGGLAEVGVLQPGDLKRFEPLIKNPGTFSLTSNNRVVLEEMQRLLETKLQVANYVSSTGYMPQISAPEGYRPVGQPKRPPVGPAVPSAPMGKLPNSLFLTQGER